MTSFNITASPSFAWFAIGGILGVFLLKPIPMVICTSMFGSFLGGLAGVVFILACVLWKGGFKRGRKVRQRLFHG